MAAVTGERDAAVAQLRQLAAKQKAKLRQARAEGDAASGEAAQLRSDSQRLAAELDRALSDVSQKSQRIDQFRETVEEQAGVIADAERRLREYEALAPGFNH
jgi:flagellar biosynthesis chaperone FliJ